MNKENCMRVVLSGEDDMMVVLSKENCMKVVRADKII